MTRARAAIAGLLGAVIIIGGGTGGFIVVHGGGGGGSTTKTAANLWVDTNGGTCTRQSTAGSYVDAQACSSMSAAQTAASAGDTVVVKCGTYSGQTLGGTAKASAVTYYAETYVQAVSVLDDFSATSCATVADLSINTSRVHVIGIQATPQPATGNSDNPGIYALGGDIGICSSGCATTTSDILIDGFHGRSAFMQATGATLDHVDMGSWNACYGDNGVHLTTGNSGTEDIIRFWSGTGGSAVPTNDTLEYSVIHDLWQGPNSSELANGCGTGNTSTGPHADCMQNNGGANITIEGNIFYNCAGDSDVQWAPFSGSSTVGPYTIENNWFGPTGCCNTLSIGSQSAENCSVITMRNNVLWSATNINANAGCTKGNEQVYGNFFRGNNSCGSQITYTWNVFGSGTCGTNVKTCTPTWSGSAPTSVSWDGTANEAPPNIQLSSADTCLKAADGATLFPSLDIFQNTRPNPSATNPEVGDQEIG